MYHVKCLNPISNNGLNLFTSQYEQTEDCTKADGILVRSASMHDMDLPEQLKAVARAGAGVNNIPLDQCADQGIVVFNTPGANANGVKELVLAGLFLASRDIVGGVNWVRSVQEEENLSKKVEKEKSRFAGHEIQGKKLGVIGLGAIGVLVANAANKLGMEVYGYDPFISVDSAWSLSRDIRHSQSADEIYEECDFITIHVPLMDNTKRMMNKEAFGKMKDGIVILNFSRDSLVEEISLLEALASGKVKKYITDFPNEKIAGAEGVLAIPHLGASTEESEENCALMAVEQLMDYLENGNIRNSVNYPACDMGTCTKQSRVTINHRNIPNMIGQFTTILATDGINISDMINKSRGNYAYTMLDLENNLSDSVLLKLKAVDGVLKVRIII